MKMSQIVRDHIEYVARKVDEKGAKALTRKSLDIMNGRNHRPDVEINVNLCVGMVLKPFREFKVYVNSKLETYNQTNLLVIYRVNSLSQFHAVPDKPIEKDIDVPRLILVVYRDTDVKDLPCREGVLQVTPTLNLSQLLLTVCQCNVVGQLEPSEM